MAEVFKEHLDWKQTYLAPERFAIRQEALMWYYCEGRNRMTVQNVPLSCHDTASNANQDYDNNYVRKTNTAVAQDTSRWLLPHNANERRDEYRVYSMNDVPSDGASDLGGPEWEQALVRRIREKNLA